MSTASQFGKDVNKAMNQGVRYINGDTPSDSCNYKNYRTVLQLKVSIKQVDTCQIFHRFER